MMNRNSAISATVISAISAINSMDIKEESKATAIMQLMKNPTDAYASKVLDEIANILMDEDAKKKDDTYTSADAKQFRDTKEYKKACKDSKKQSDAVRAKIEKEAKKSLIDRDKPLTEENIRKEVNRRMRLVNRTVDDEAESGSVAEERKETKEQKRKREMIENAPISIGDKTIGKKKACIGKPSNGLHEDTIVVMATRNKNGEICVLPGRNGRPNYFKMTLQAGDKKWDVNLSEDQLDLFVDAVNEYNNNMLQKSEDEETSFNEVFDILEKTPFKCWTVEVDGKLSTYYDYKKYSKRMWVIQNIEAEREDKRLDYEAKKAAGVQKTFMTDGNRKVSRKNSKGE